ncbi:VWA domain-containing protein [Bifidobacterium jacchi]|uniref:VWA domain-containing protein n=1 Tax=Bifidobacterium jacchi TaxID=2490545 RepID=A0A5N5RF52_9BIFI|nr:VWA domain-containing protein [Bifidobacterium jacchi]KAB5605879.1 VWA domain-containing protein [Bifidobacterium jacchi]
MTIVWQWPWAALAALIGVIALIVLTMALMPHRPANAANGANTADNEDAANTANDAHDGAITVFSLDDDRSGEQASMLMRRWRAWNRVAVALIALATALAIVLVARPSQIDQSDDRSSSRDIVLCLDVSGSTLPYDRQVIETYRDLVAGFKGERIALSIFNSTSRTVFPLTDDYDLVSRQLKDAADILRGVETQSDIDKMSDEQYQRISDWLEGTQNRRDATSLIGDGVVGCAAMLPGFTYGGSASGTGSQRRRAASIVLATDNIVSGTPSYTLAQALDLTKQAGIVVDGLFSGPTSGESDATTTDMRAQIESHGGTFLTQSNGTDVSSLVRDIESRSHAQVEQASHAAMADAPGWWTLAACMVVAVWLILAWRLRR